MTFFEFFFTSLVLLVLYGVYRFYRAYKQTKLLLTEEEFERLVNPDTPIEEKRILMDKMEKDAHRFLGESQENHESSNQLPKTFRVVGRCPKPIGYFLDQKISRYILLDSQDVYEFDGAFDDKAKLTLKAPAGVKSVMLGNLRYTFHSSPTLMKELDPLGIVLNGALESEAETS